MVVLTSRSIGQPQRTHLRHTVLRLGYRSSCGTILLGEVREVGSAAGLYLESGFRIDTASDGGYISGFHDVAPFLSYSLNSSD